MINMDPAALNKELGYLVLYLVVAIPVLILYLWLSKKARNEWMVLMGQLKPKLTHEWERREYVRLGSIFPVEFQKVEDGRLGTLHEGFTRDISRSGICIEAKTLHAGQLEGIAPDRTKLKLIINMPIYARPTEATCTVKWIQKIEELPLDKYAIGVSYDNIREEDASRLIKYALWLHRKPVFLASIMVLSLLIISVLFTFLSDMRTSKRRLRRELDAVSQERRTLVDRVKDAEHEKTGLEERLETLKEEAIIKKEPVKEKPPQEAELKDVREMLDQLLEEDTYYEEEGEEEPVYTEEAEPVMPEEPLVSEEAAVPAEPVISEEDAIMKRLIKEEAPIYKKFRDYILNENMQLLDRYCYQHRSSIYHAAALFALAELRYKHGYGWDAIENTYEEVIKEYPRSKYASYASHRLEQAQNKRSYSIYTLRYYYVTYGLQPLLDYREIEPYRK